MKVVENFDRDYLLYDGECPVCEHYVLWTNLKATYPEIDLLNARNHQKLVNQLRLEGIEINDTMVLSVAGEKFIGSRAMAKLSEYVQPIRFHQKILKITTQEEKFLRILYPVLVKGRKLLLFLIRKTKIS